MNISEEIKKAIKYGIFLGDISDDESDLFLRELNLFLIKKKNFCFFSNTTKAIIVSSDLEDLAEIFIHRGTLKVTPLAAEGYFKIFMDMLEFISKKHKKETEDKAKVKVKTTEEDESTEDDGDLWL